ncbi:transporter substrate-binding domain-containing protein [Chelatococcus sp. SYSU_G07232]|uniref:Transporter substrate-binding domain-containing protein n=1 Tax=Chelatococcus albus TaxID=3047466 RepID=A0ABT7AKA0_9HYPH|nr:transporter substrate-binding domain-containing protein [Chelatococcus sp. SYSU_G07232]MDJ1159807.1 transporter substrate-binding domain-containing protein [Chelatococcus sp. SYSU_G07232]
MKIARLAALSAAILLAGLGGAYAQQKEWKTVRIGTEGAYPPYNNLNAKGELEGFEIDYAKALCAKMKVTCTFVAQDWDGIIPALLAGKYDVIIAGMNATDERKQKVAFSHTYVKEPPAFIASKKVTSTDVTPAALKGKTIGTQSSTIHANFLEKFYPDAKIKLYPTQEEANLDLANGRLDYVVADKTSLWAFLKDKGKDCCKHVADVKRDPAIHGEGVAVAFRKEDTALLEMFNKAIDESLKDGTHKAIAAKWFDYEVM